MSLLRHQVLREYKNIFKAISHATMGDKVAADHFRKGINDVLSFFVREQTRLKFKENDSLKDEIEIEKQIQLAKDVELVVRKHLAQFQEIEPNRYKSNFRSDLEWMDDANRPKGAPAAGVGCQLPPKIEPRRRRKRNAKKADS